MKKSATGLKQIRGIWLPKTDTHLEGQIKLYPLVNGKGTYQYHKYERARSHVQRRGHAVDIGGQIGLWSRVMAIDFEKVTVFEPLPIHLECFIRNTLEHDNIQLYPVALDSKPGKLIMNIPSDSTGNTHVAIGKEKGVEVISHTLDSFNLKNIDFLKIDVEGYELPIILGGENTIRNEKPIIIIEQKPNGNAERYGRKQLDAVDMLVSWGGRVSWSISGDYLVEWK